MNVDSNSIHKYFIDHLKGLIHLRLYVFCQPGSDHCTIVNDNNSESGISAAAADVRSITRKHSWNDFSA